MKTRAVLLDDMVPSLRRPLPVGVFHDRKAAFAHLVFLYGEELAKQFCNNGSYRIHEVESFE